MTSATAPQGKPWPQIITVSRFFDGLFDWLFGHYGVYLLPLVVSVFAFFIVLLNDGSGAPEWIVFFAMLLPSLPTALIPLRLRAEGVTRKAFLEGTATLRAILVPWLFIIGVVLFASRFSDSPDAATRSATTGLISLLTFGALIAAFGPAQKDYRGALPQSDPQP